MSKLREFCLYFGLLSLLLNFSFQYSTLYNYPELLKNALLCIGLFSLIISYVLKKNNKLLIKIMVLTFSILIYIFSKQTAIFELIILIISTEKTELERIIKFCYKYLVFFLFFHILTYIIAYILGVNNLNIIVRTETNTIRHSFFLAHSNLFGTLCSWTYLTYIYLNKNHLKRKHFIIGIITIIFISTTCDSRTSAFVCLITIILLASFKKIGKTANILKHSFSIIGILAYLLVFLYPTSDFIKSIDTPDKLHGRIKLGYIAYNYQMLGPLGKDIKMFENINLYPEYGINKYTIDSTYYKMLFVYGYIFTIAFFIYFEKKVSYIENNDNFICFIFAYSLATFMESFSFYPFIFFPLFVISTNSDKKKEVQYEKK